MIKSAESKYKVIFSSHIRASISAETDKYLAKASLEQLKPFLPDFDTEKNYDCLKICANAYVANRFNLNSDGLDGKTAIETAPLFVSKYFDVAHNRGQIVGVILNYGFSEFGTDKPLTAEEVKGKTDPFNIFVSGILWRLVNEDLANLVEDASDPSSKNYLSLSLSFEMGFSDYDIVQIAGNSKNLEDGTIITDNKAKLSLEPKMKCNGGTGIDGDKRLYRLATTDVLPLGIGIVTDPAAAVIGIATEATKTDDKSAETKTSTGEIKPKTEELQPITSQTTQDNVKTTEFQTIMKITATKDITDETLKTMTAGVILDFIGDELRKESEKYSAQLKEKDTVAKDIQAKFDTTKSEHDTLVKENEVIKKKLTEIETTQAEKNASDAFDTRMAKFDETYNLDADIREVLAKDLKGMSAEAFTAYEIKMTKVLKSQKKVAPVVDKTKEIVGSTKEVVKDVVENLVKDKKEIIANTTEEHGEKTLKEKYAKAFDEDGFIVTASRKPK